MLSKRLFLAVKLQESEVSQIERIQQEWAGILNDDFKIEALPQFSLNLQVLEFALYESRTENSRVRYETIESWKLK